MNVDNKKLWDEEYASGKWKYLEEPAEKSRHAIIAMYTDHYKPKGRILDVGCGECILMSFLTEIQMKNYLGIDISEKAVQLAREKRNANAIVIDAYDFESAERFDVIIFNEVIYYLDFVKIFEKYSSLLTEDGLIILSVFTIDKLLWRIPWMYLQSRITKESKKYFKPIESIRLKGKAAGKKMNWTIDVMTKQCDIKSE